MITNALLFLGPKWYSLTHMCYLCVFCWWICIAIPHLALASSRVGCWKEAGWVLGLANAREHSNWQRILVKHQKGKMGRKHMGEKRWGKWNWPIEEKEAWLTGVSREERGDNCQWKEDLVKKWKNQRSRLNTQVVAHNWNAAFQLGRIFMPLLWNVAHILCQLLLRHFYGLQAVKSHCTGSTGWDVRDLQGPCVHPARPLAYTGDAPWALRPEEEAAAPGSCSTIQGQPGVCSLLHSPSKANTTAGSTSPQQADIPFHGPQIQTGQWNCPFDCMP